MTITELQKDEVKNLIRQGRNIEAVKYLRDNFGLSLKHAKYLTDNIAYEIQDEIIRDFTGSAFSNRTFKGKSINVGRMVGGIFAFVGIIFLSITIYVFLKDKEFVEHSVKVQGVVVKYPSKPLFEYEYKGEFYNYQATATSNPPSYYIGEEVQIFINPDHPQEALVDNFSERWLLATISGGMVLLFFTIGSISFFLLGKK